jgi:hypothetical protein
MSTPMASPDRVGLFLERAAVLRSSTAVTLIDETRITLRLDRAGGSADLVAPNDEATLAYFARIRHFDTPRTDLYVPDFFPNLETGATPERADVVAHVRQSHTDLGRQGNDWPKIVLGETATPRAVWELWTYSQVLHTDPAKRATWADLDGMRQGMAKFIAHSYAGDLYHLVTVVEAMLRDPQLDHRGLKMQFLATRPEFVGTPGIEAFSAARVRLLGDVEPSRAEPKARPRPPSQP